MLNILVTAMAHFPLRTGEVGLGEMDSYREHPSDFDVPVDDVTAQIGTDERRMHVRAYNYWVSLLDSRDFPSIEDLEPGEVADFASNSELLVHQQDIQAVVNALWAGGAEAMTIQGQRVVATTGIKCVGNTVVLHGVPSSPPYRISAIGPTQTLLSTVSESPYIKFYLEVVRQSGLGWDVKVNPVLRLPGYDGATELEFARPATAARG